jgi:hypothetical protein
MILLCRGEDMSPTGCRAVSSQTCEPKLRRQRSSSWKACAVAAAAVIGLMATGCAGYRVGNNTLYAANVRTVYVPLFQSDSYRTTPSIDIGERITEAVCKEIERRTPFKVVGTAEDADSVLTGRVVADTKRMVVESPTDQSRMVQVNYQVLVTWADRGGAVLAKGDVPLPAASVDVGQAAALVPEYGRSVASTQQEAIIKIAQQVVGLMEEPW